MTEKFINLVAYVDGQEIKWKLNPAPQTLYDEIHEFAASICELCKISIRNKMITGQKKKDSVSLLIVCEECYIPCNDYKFNTDNFQMRNSSFEYEMYGLKMSISEAVVVAVVSTEKFINQYEVLVHG